MTVVLNPACPMPADGDIEPWKLTHLVIWRCGGLGAGLRSYPGGGIWMRSSCSFA